MPLTALIPSGALIDSTSCTEDEWEAVRGVAAPDRPRCRDCRGMMSAKISRTGLRFFAHIARPESCAMGGESPEHRRLKHRIALLIRELGFDAAVEAGPAVDDAGGWRADVLGAAATGRRVAFEVQLAGMTIAEGRDRTKRYARDGIETVWVSTKHAPWMTALPSARLKPDEHPLTADRGLARWRQDDDYGRWEPAEEVLFASVVRGMLRGTITTAPIPSFSEKAGKRTYWIDNARLLVSRKDRELYDKKRAQEQRESAQRRREEEKHHRNIKALVERQHRVMRTGLQHAAKAAAPAQHQIWFGHQETQWSGNLPAPREECTGHPATAMGVPIWIGERASQAQLWAVICPVASRINDGLARRWRIDGVRVYAETTAEADSLARKLRWPPGQILCPSW